MKRASELEINEHIALLSGNDPVSCEAMNLRIYGVHHAGDKIIVQTVDENGRHFSYIFRHDQCVFMASGRINFKERD